MRLAGFVMLMSGLCQVQKRQFWVTHLTNLSIRVPSLGLAKLLGALPVTLAWIVYTDEEERADSPQIAECCEPAPACSSEHDDF